MAAQTVSLAATGVLLWHSVIGRKLLYQPLPELMAHALLFAVIAWVWSAATTFFLFLILPGSESSRMVGRTLRTASVAVWFAPACILLSHLSPATLIASLALVITATRLFYSEWMASAPPAAETPSISASIARGMFGENAPRQPVITRELATGIAAAVSMEWGVISIWKHQPLFAGCWFVLSAAIVTLFALVSGAVADGPPPTLPRSALGILATIMLGATLTVGGLRMARGSRAFGEEGDGPPGSGLGAAASAREVLRELFGDKDAGQSGQGTARPPQPQSPTPAIAADGTFPGVILWPEVNPVTRLVAPLPRGGGPGLAIAQTYSIPFDGQYLLYQWPMIHPPATSVLQRGSPAVLAYRTTNHGRLNMDAIQKFDEPVDLACCSKLRVEIRNADRYPGTVSLEVLADDDSLGTQPVLSRPNVDQDAIVAVPESLDFAIPPGIQPVKELKVVFRRARVRADKSARIAIDRFLLLP